MASKVKTLCEEKVVPVIENLGYEVVEVEYAKKNDGMNLTFFIDKEEGVKIEDCEKVSKEIMSLPMSAFLKADDQDYIVEALCKAVLETK